MSWQNEELETVACDFCGSTHWTTVIRRPDGLSAVECSDCHLCYLSPRPIPQQVAKLYSEHYFSKGAQQPDIGYANYLAIEAQRGQRLEAKSRLATIRKFFSFEGKNCLEIGCATGEFARLAASHGAKVTGIDISEEAIRYAKTRYPNIDFKCCDVGGLGKSEKFDLVCGFEVIEHVLSPGKFLDQISSVLSHGGLVALSTPNYECAKRLGADNWLGFHTSFEHLYFLCPSSVRRYSERRGFKTVQWFTDKATGERQIANLGSNSSRSETANRVLGGFGLLQSIRRIKNALACQYGTAYERQGLGHNLLIILRKC